MLAYWSRKWVNKYFQGIQSKICNTWPGLWKGIGSPFCNWTEPFPPSLIPPPWHLTGKWTNVIPVIAPLSDIIIVHITILLLILIITIVVSTMYDTWLGNELMWSRRLRHYLRSHQAHHHCRKNHWRQMRSQCQIYHISILESLKSQIYHFYTWISEESLHFYTWIS